MKKNEFQPQVSPKYKKQLADELGYSLRTFQRRLKMLEIDIPRGLITPEEQEGIIKSMNSNKVARNGTKWHEMARNK